MKIIRTFIFLILNLIFLSFLFACQIQEVKSNQKDREQMIIIRLKYEKNLDNKPIKIILKGKTKEYSKDVIENQLNYYFTNLKSGKYLILLTFNEKGKKPYKVTYGLETWIQESIDVNSEGNVNNKTEIRTDNQIKVSGNRNTFIDLLLTFEKPCNDFKPPITKIHPISGQFFKIKYFYKKENKSYYYKIIFKRSFMLSKIDKKELKWVKMGTVG